MAEVVAVEYLEGFHDEAVGLIEALWFCERGGNGEFGGEARISLEGTTDHRECTLGGGGTPGEEATGAIELVGEFVEEQLVGTACGFGHGTHLG
jgi:hypothetical protein